jgi:hypothetical protein
MNAAGNEDMIKATQDGAVELFHNNVKTLRTETNGLTILGTEGGDAALHLYADEGDDNADKWKWTALTEGSCRLYNYTDGSWETTARFVGGESAYLYHNNAQKFRTVSDGIQIEGGEGEEAIVTLMADEGDDTASDYWRMRAGTDSTFKTDQYNGSAWYTHLQLSNSWFLINSVEGNQSGPVLKLEKPEAADNVQSTIMTFSVNDLARGNIVSGHSGSSNPQFSTYSDRRLKTNFRTYTGGYDKIKAIPVKLYDEISGPKDLVGWIADEFQLVFPEAVQGTKDAVDSDGKPIYQSLAQGTIFPDVVQALQAAIAKIEVLETKVATLEAG